MGKVYKLKPEIIALIIEQKRNNPAISCRKLEIIIKDKFNIKISKSSINSLFKGSGLSMPVGRRSKSGGTAFKSRIPGFLAAEMNRTEKDNVVPAEPITQDNPMGVEEPPVVAPVAPELPLPGDLISQTQELPDKKSVPEEDLSTQDIVLQGVMKSEVIEGETTGAVILKAADSLLGGLNLINQTIREHLKLRSSEFEPKTEGVFYASLFGEYPYLNLKSDSGLWPLVGKNLNPEELVSYLNTLQDFKSLPGQILQALPAVFSVVRGIKVNLSDGGVLYFDGDLHTIWSTPYIPRDFSATLCRTKESINGYLGNKDPYIFFMAPGTDYPASEFFDLLLCMYKPEMKNITQFTLYDWELQDLDRIKIEQSQKHLFIIGFWPWQFVQQRKIVSLGEFKEVFFAPLNKEFFLAPIEIEIMQTSVNKGVILKGCALKTNLNEKIRLLILSNFPEQGDTLQQSFLAYLSRWPNLEEAFHDYSRKIEMFIYASNSEPVMPLDVSLDRGGVTEIKTIFQRYLQALDVYVRNSFFPAGFERTDFSSMKENFYGLKVLIKEAPDYCAAVFQLPAGYRFRNALEYAIRRLNEKEIYFVRGKKLWFSALP